jgi:death-on-curing protein
MKKIVWIDASEVHVFHDRLLAEHGGPGGIRDAALLESALARPRQHAAYGAKAEIIALAALYTAAIVRNHPFVDGNKRTAFLVGVLFLEMNGYEFTARQEDAAEAVLALAAGDWDEATFAGFLEANFSKARRA